MLRSRSAGRASRSPSGWEGGAEKPPRQRGRAVFTLLHCPGELLAPVAADSVGAARPMEQLSLRGEPRQAPQKRAAGERGSEEARVPVTPLTPPAADATQEGPPPASLPRAPASRSPRARPKAAEGEGRLRARPLLRRPNFPQLPQLSCALTVRLPGLPRGPSRSSSAPWPRRRTIGGRSLGGGGGCWSKEQARRSRPSPNA